MTTVFAFLAAIGILVAVHELGHYAMAVACGVKVNKFSIGFGPRLIGWTSRKSGTEFVLSVLPLGGYVSMLDGRVAPIPEGESQRAFDHQPLIRRALIVVAGPVANLVLAVALYAGIGLTGQDMSRAVLSKPEQGSSAALAGIRGGELVISAGLESEDLLHIRSFEDLRWLLLRATVFQKSLTMEMGTLGPDGSVNAPMVVTLPTDSTGMHDEGGKVLRKIGISAPHSPALVGSVEPEGAAARAGLQAGDLVISLDGEDIVDAAQLRSRIRVSGQTEAPQKQMWTVLRLGSRVELTVTPAQISTGSERMGRVGAMIGASPEMVHVKDSLLPAVRYALRYTWELSELSVRTMWGMLTGDMSLRNLSGPITIADYAGRSASMGTMQFLTFLALVSVSLGVLNLLPLPALDGGHLMYYLWEWCSGKAVTEPWLERFQKVGVGVLLVMMSIAVFNDVNRLLQ